MFSGDSTFSRFKLINLVEAAHLVIRCKIIFDLCWFSHSNQGRQNLMRKVCICAPNIWSTSKEIPGFFAIIFLAVCYCLRTQFSTPYAAPANNSPHCLWQHLY